MNPEKKDIHWELQFSDFRKALAKLAIAIEIFRPNDEENLELEEVDDLLKEGLIKRFEYTRDLAWNVMKEYAAYHGNKIIREPEDAITESLKSGLITEPHDWKAMLANRNEISCMYEENTTDAIFLKILETYGPLFIKFEHKMEELHSGN